MRPGRPPIIVLGANHSGTRLLVEVLTALGSDPGDVANVWREESSFLKLHKYLIGQASESGWDETIFDPLFAERFRDDGRFVSLMQDHVAQYVDEHRLGADARAWHWKCPTSLLFLPSWLEVLPDAYFVHVERDPLEVARSLLRRREVRRLSDGERFYRAMNDRARDAAPAIRRYFRVQFEDLGGQLTNIAQATDLDPVPEQLDSAKHMIRSGPTPIWDPNRSLRRNVREVLTSLQTRLYRSPRHGGG